MFVLQLFIVQSVTLKLEINRSFLIKPFFYITKKSGQKLKNLKNGKIGELQSRKAAKNCAKKSNLNKIFQNFLGKVPK